MVHILLSLALVFALTIAAIFLLGFKPLAVLSGDMRPTIPAGSMALAGPVTFGEIEEDVIIAFRDADGTILVRRVIEIDFSPPTLFTMRDATETEDEDPVPYENVVGAVRLWIPLAGYALSFVSGPPGNYIAGAAVLVLIVLFLLLGEKKKQKIMI